MATPFATAEGSLYELVSRGNKDVFFYQDLFDSKFIFDNQYEAQAPASFEVRRVPPSTAVEFGRTVQFQVDLIGDILLHPTIVMQLPTWLPPSITNSNGVNLNNRSIITDLSGFSYGYTNGIAYFLFELIQIFQDNILLQEFSGDALWAANKPTGTYGHSFVTNQLTGQHGGTALEIQRNSTPQQLRLELPFIGCQRAGGPGFPERSVQQHTYRIRLKLRKLEDLVESSDTASTAKPTPWNRTYQMKQSRDPSAPQTRFQALGRLDIQPLTLLLETTHVYVPSDYQQELQTKPQQVTFRRLWENVFTQNQKDYLPVTNGGTATLSRRLDGRHPSEKVTWFFRNQADIRANRLWKLQQGYTNLSLLIAGQSRELPRTPFIWRDITNFAKEETDTGDELNTMNWGLGAVVAPAAQPTGAVNFTTADRPTFYFDLAQAPIDPLTGAPNTELRVIVEGWARFDTDGRGRGELYSGN